MARLARPWLAAILLLLATPAAAAPITVTVNASEPVIVTGAPRLPLRIGNATRLATYAGAQGTPVAALAFRYDVQPGDFDPDGIAIDGPLDATGAAIADRAGNAMTAFSFTKPNTTNLKVQTYTAAFTSTSNLAAVSFTVGKASAGATFDWSIASSGGLGTVGGFGNFSGLTQTVSGIDVTGLAAGTLTLTVTASLGGANGEARFATFTPTLTGALDGLPAAAALYSVRRLRGAYAGPLMRVRRNTDDAQRDIAATIRGDLDLATLTTFCGTASCFIATWYDQSGNGQDVTQPSANNQPRIVTAGTAESEGARPALRFDGGNLRLDTAAPVAQTLAATFNAVARCTETSVNRHILGDRSIGAPAAGRQIRALSGGSGYFGANIGGATVSLTGATTQQRVVTVLSSSSGMSGALDGVTAAGSASTYFTSSGYIFRIGGGGQGQGGGDWVGTISEATLFNSTFSTSDRQTLERNQGTYYGITVP